MLSELQIGYLAGLIDGEGQVSIVRNVRRDARKRHRGYQLRAEVRIGQRRRILLSTVLGWIGEHNGHIGRYGLEQKFFCLRFKSSWLRANLPAIMPHLILKRRQAEIVLEFLASPRSVGRNGVGAEKWAIRDSMRSECIALNADRSNALT